MKRAIVANILFTAVLLPIVWFLWPVPRVCGEPGLGLKALNAEVLKLGAVVFGFTVLWVWISWKTGWPGLIPARPKDRQAARWLRFLLVAGLPLGLAICPTVMLFHWSGVFGKDATQRLERMPEKGRELQEKKLTPEESRKLVLKSFDSFCAGLQKEVRVCQALRIHSSLVLLAMGWFLFWSYRIIFYPPASQIADGIKKRSDGAKASKNRPKKRNP